MRHNGRIGLTKEHIRRIVLSKLRIVYRHWQSKENPFSSGKKSGSRRSDARAFETALVASLLGSLSEAIEQNKWGARWKTLAMGSELHGKGYARERCGLAFTDASRDAHLIFSRSVFTYTGIADGRSAVVGHFAA